MSQGHIKSIVPHRSGVAPIDNNTVAYFPFDTNATDVIQGVKPIGEQYALSFNGNDSYVELGSPLSIFNTSFTISMWCYFNDNSRAILFGDYARPNTINVNFERTITNQLRLYWAASPDIYTASNVVSANKWHHTTVVRDKERSSVLFYVDGVLVYTYSGALSDKTTQSLHLIGRDNRTGATAMNGRIGDVKVWNKALSEEEVILNMNKNYSDTNLVGHWKLDEDGPIVYDYSSYGNDGVNNGATLIKGPAVYSLAKEGYPGGVIQSQEATENLITNPKLTNNGSGWGILGGGTILSQQDYAIVTKTSSATHDGIFFDAGLGLKVGAEYTFSYYAKYISGGQKIGSHIGPSTGSAARKVRMDGEPWAVGDTVTVPNDGSYHRIEVKSTIPAGYTDTLYYIQVGRTMASTSSFHIKNVQLEEKSYATEFTPGKRSARQSYGGGVLIEEGTTNIIATESNNLKDWVTTRHTDTGKTILNPLGEPAKIWAVSDEGYAYLDSTLAVGQTYTASIYVYPNLDYTFRLRLGKDPVADNISIFAPANQWTRIINTKTANNVRVLVGYRDTDGAANTPVGFEVAYSMAQVEQKSFATSFVDGTREQGSLNYRLDSPINTLSFWFRPLVPNDYSIRNNWVLCDSSESNNVDNLMIWKRSTETYYRIRVQKTDLSFDSLDISPDKFQMIALSSNGVDTKVFLNGELKGTISKPIITQNISLCRYNYSTSDYDAYAGNNIIDELRIDKIARTPEEIQAWYYQGKNGW